MRILIIEDEMPAAKRLQRLILEILPNAEIFPTIDSVEEATVFFRKGDHVDLTFMDIQLADGLSFEIFSQCEVTTPVIFTTAYDHYAVKAFKVNSVDYLLKPVESAELQSAINRFKEFFEPKTPQNDYSAIIQTIKENKSVYKKRFLVKTAGRLTFVNSEDVAYLFSDDGNTFLVTKSNDRFLFENTLEEVEPLLDPSNFFRINRKMILALDSIKKIEPHFNSRYLLQIHPLFEEETIVSRQRSAEFKSWLDS
jgi:DNA-binding LytR/AlgR family response regulator